jgi:hypothetical protein
LAGALAAGKDFLAGVGTEEFEKLSHLCVDAAGKFGASKNAQFD